MTNFRIKQRKNEKNEMKNEENEINTFHKMKDSKMRKN